MRLSILFFLIVSSFFGSLGVGAEPNATVVYLDDLDLTQTECGYKETQKNRTIDGGPLTVAGKNFERGVGHHSPGNIVVQLPPGKVRFSCEVGIADETNGLGRVNFLVYSDGDLLWQSDFMTGAQTAKRCELELVDRSSLVLYADAGPEGYAFDHAVWGDAKFECDASSNVVEKLRIVRPLFVDASGLVFFEDDPSYETRREFVSLKRQLAEGMSENVAKTAAHPQAALWETDRDPLDVVVRRTSQLLTTLTEMRDDDELDSENAAWSEFLARYQTSSPEQTQDRFELFEEATRLRRSIALKNPELDFSDVLFIKRHYNPEAEKEGNHMCDQFFGFHARPGGGLFRLENAFGDEPKLTNVLENSTVANGRLAGTKLDSTWGFLSPHLTYDGKQIYFAAADTKTPRHTYLWSEDNCYHIFRVDLDGKNLVQLTDGPWNDFDPYFMPNGRIAFISERRGGYGRCHARPCPSYTLHSMNPDGSDIVALSVHETNEWAPTVDNNGMIVYTRWDYVDRGFNQAHHPWITFPDGRDSRAIQGNYSEVEQSRPHFETTLKPIPDSPRFVAIASGHHTQNFGSVILIDPTIEDDDTGNDPMAPIRRATPEQLFPESEIGTHGPPHNYGQPYPLSEDFFLVVYDAFSGSGKGELNDYGIYLLDVFGNKILIYRDPKISCQWPLAVESRPVPPIVPHQTLVGIPEDQKMGKIIPEELPKTATVGVTNVYTTTRPFPEGTKIKELRVVQILPKTTTHANVPWVGFAGENGARKVLGTVPVEEDGSARFETPVDVPVYFQALDENGVAVQTMRSATYVHPGETLVCLGCHEGRHATAQNTTTGNPIAFRREPSKIKPDVPGSNPFNYPTLVQNILDRRCVECHDQESKAGKTFALDRGDPSQYFLTSYTNLRPFVYVNGNGNANLDVPVKEQPTHGGAWNRFTPGKTMPGQFGANRSPLWKLLEDGHYDVRLTSEEKRAFALWMDNNCDFFGAYELETLDAQRRGEVVTPSLE